LYLIDKFLNGASNPLREAGSGVQLGQFCVQFHAKIVVAVSLQHPMNRVFQRCVFCRSPSDFAYESCLMSKPASAPVAQRRAVANRRP